MTAFVRAFLRCDRCGEFFRTDTIPPDYTVTEARSAAKRDGWVQPMHEQPGAPRVKIDVCYGCWNGDGS